MTGTHILRETPSCRKRHTPESKTHIHTHGESDTFTLRERHTLIESKHTERHTPRHAETCKLRGTHILRDINIQREKHTHTLRTRHAHERDTLREGHTLRET